MITRGTLFHSNNADRGQEELGCFQGVRAQDNRDWQSRVQGARDKLNTTTAIKNFLGVTQWVIK